MFKSTVKNNSDECHNSENNSACKDGIKPGKSKAKYLIFDGILFLIVFFFLLTTALSSMSLSHTLFRKEPDAIKTPSIVGRDRIYGVAVIDGSSFWLVGNHGKILKSTDSGKSFQKQTSSTKFDLQDIGSWDPDQAVIVGDEGIILTTGDGGDHWKEISGVPKTEIANKLMRVLTLKDGRAFAVGAMGMILLTEDYGETWTRVSESEDVAWNDITFADENTGWVAGEFGTIMKTTDGGMTWELQDTSVENSIMAIAAKDMNNVRACGLEGILLDTIDGGNSWNSFNADTKEHFLDILVDDNSWVSIGTGGLLSFYDSEDSEWEMQRLSEKDFYWHTEIAKLGADYIIVGQTSGILSQKLWNLF